MQVGCHPVSYRQWMNQIIVHTFVTCLMVLTIDIRMMGVKQTLPTEPDALNKQNLSEYQGRVTVIATVAISIIISYKYTSKKITTIM